MKKSIILIIIALICLFGLLFFYLSSKKYDEKIIIAAKEIITKLSEEENSLKHNRENPKFVENIDSTIEKESTNNENTMKVKLKVNKIYDIENIEENLNRAETKIDVAIIENNSGFDISKYGNEIYLKGGNIRTCAVERISKKGIKFKYIEDVKKMNMKARMKYYYKLDSKEYMNLEEGKVYDIVLKIRDEKLFLINQKTN